VEEEEEQRKGMEESIRATPQWEDADARSHVCDRGLCTLTLQSSPATAPLTGPADGKSFYCMLELIVATGQAG